MSKTFQLDIVTPDKSLFSDLVDMVIVRTSEGDIGILHDHEMTVAPLAIGAIKVKMADQFKVASCAGGFVDVENEKVTIVTDAAEWADDINVARAEAAKARASERLANPTEEVKVDRARISLYRAINRIRIANEYEGHKE